jgi:preprotein translocase subunit SecY
MGNSKIVTSLRSKIFKILGLLLLVRLGLYIPIPNIDINLFESSNNTNIVFGFAKTLTGSSFLGVGSLGILPYINSSILIQILTSVIPSLERLQKEDGEIGRQKINRYTRYLTFVWALGLSSGIAFGFVKPLVFDWNLILAIKIILSLTTGSLLSMWFAELITEEGLGNGSSMLIFINIIGSIPNNFLELEKKVTDDLYLNKVIFFTQCLILYFGVVFIIVIFQEAYKKIVIASAKQLNLNYNSQTLKTFDLKNSYIPLKLNQGGVMPLVFSSTVATLFYYPLQLISNSSIGRSITILPKILTFSISILNISLVIFFSCFYAVLVLKPLDISKNLAKMAYNIPGIRQGKETAKYLEQTVTRVAFLGGLVLSFLAFFPIVLSNVFNFNVFKNVTSLLILIGVIIDTTSQIRGYLVSRNYESF